MSRTDDEEQRAWKRVRREESGISRPEENQAFGMACNQTPQDDVPLPGRMRDWHTAAAWESSHWPKLRKALQDIDARDHSAIDRTFEEYQRKNRLLMPTYANIEMETRP
jgi:hypothetical protein